MQKVISIIQQMNIRVSSTVWAIQDINEYYGNIDKSTYDEYIFSLTGMQIETTDSLNAEIIFKYIVCGFIQNYLNNIESDVSVIVENSIRSADVLISANESIMKAVRSARTESNMGHIAKKQKLKKIAAGPKPPSKQAIAIEIIENNITLDKAAILDKIISEIGISKQHAMMCYYKWKRKTKVDVG